MYIPLEATCACRAEAGRRVKQVSNADFRDEFEALLKTDSILCFRGGIGLYDLEDQNHSISH